MIISKKNQKFFSFIFVVVVALFKKENNGDKNSLSKASLSNLLDLWIECQMYLLPKFHDIEYEKCEWIQHRYQLSKGQQVKRFDCIHIGHKF